MIENNTDDHAQTRHYALPLYMDASPLDLRDGYNRSMRIIDQKLYQLEIQIREAKGQDK